MTSVNDQAKSVKTKHKGIDAILGSYWESYRGGHVSITFELYNKKIDDFRIEKEYRPRSEKYLSGKFSNKDVIKDYGARFNQWVKGVNKRKYLKW